MKKIEFYLEASALWNLFYGEPSGNTVEYCIDRDEVHCISSVWSQLEIWRGIQKRINQDEITHDEGRDLRRFIQMYLDNLIAKKRLLECDVSRELVEKGKIFVSRYNLYASDALHFSTAIAKECRVILVDNYHVERLGENVPEELNIEVWNTSMSIDEIASDIEMLQER